MSGPLSGSSSDNIFDRDQKEAPERPFDHETWERLRLEQLGVYAIDPLGHEIGWAAADRWAPVDKEKQILVGEFDHYGFYNPSTWEDPFGDPDEADFNIHIAPDPAFSFILDQVAKDMEDRSQLQKRLRRPGFCVECEITPDEGFYDNPYFPTKEPFSSPLEGHKLGVYGPWVRDGGHGGRPEIHPCEIIWWEGTSNRLGVKFTRFFLVLQDDSNRFDRPENYDGPVPRPWSASPRRARIVVALQPDARMHNRYELRIDRSRNIHDIENPGPPSFTVNYQGNPAVSVVKQTRLPNTVGVDLSEIAPDPDGRSLRCFLSIVVEVGSGDRGEEGYVLLRLETLA